MMRRVLVWVSSIGLLAGALVLGTQVSSAPKASAAVNGAWSALGGGLNGRVFVTYQADDTAAISSSNPLYVGGAFTNAGGDADADYLAKWDGSAWSKVATTALTARGGVYLNYVASIAKEGNNLYVGGVFVAGVSLNIITIDLTTGNFSNMGTGVSGGTDDSVVEEIAVVGTGAGAKVYVGGAFDNASGVSNTVGIAVWDGTSWDDLAGGVSSRELINGMATDGTTLYVGGQFPGTSSVTSQSVLSWNGTAWSAMNATQRGFTRISSPLTAAILARSSTEVYAAGRFTSTNDSTVGDRITLNGIAKWNGTAWSALGTGISGGNAVVETLAYAGSTLWAGGDFTSAGGVSANNIAKWDGTSWDSITCGTNNGVSGGAVRGIAPQSDGSVIVAGGFTNAGGYSYIAKFTPGADNCTTLTEGPTEPRNVRAEWTDSNLDAVRISWDPAESDGGLQILGWQAASFDDMVSCWTPSFSCVISINDVPGEARTSGGFLATSEFLKRTYLIDLVRDGFTRGFYARAGTSQGWGKKGWAVPYEPPPPVISSAPLAVKASPGRNKVTVTWSPPASPGNYPITNYLVKASPGTELCITRLTDASLTTCEFTALKPGVDYTFKVQALTGAGWSPRSKASNEASPYDLNVVDVKAKKKLFIFREVKVVGTSPGYKAGERVRLSWRQVGASGWQSSKNQVIRTNGKPKARYTYTVTLPRKAGGKTFEFRLGSGGEFSNPSTVRIP